MTTTTNTASTRLIRELVEERLQISNIKRKLRTREMSQARFIYFKLAKNFCRYKSLSAIGREVNRDHATVINGLKKYEVEANIDHYMHDVYDELSNKLDKNYIKPGRNQNVDITIEQLLKRIETIEVELLKIKNGKQQI